MSQKEKTSESAAFIYELFQRRRQICRENEERRISNKTILLKVNMSVRELSTLKKRQRINEVRN